MRALLITLTLCLSLAATTAFAADHSPVLGDKAAKCLDVETASAKDLQTLKGVGEVIAKEIINFRKAKRAAATKDGKAKWMFRNWATLYHVKGVGPKICADNVAKVCFSGKVQKTCPKAKKTTDKADKGKKK